jgi:hypothetical protein
VHPFWSSHEEKWACVRLSLGGSHGRSWSFHGSPWGACHRGSGGGRGKERGAQLGGQLGRGRGRHGGCRRGLAPAAATCSLLPA